MQHLMGEQLAAASISIHSSVDPPSLELTADPEQIEQVMINLLRNAIDALQGVPNPRVEVRGSLDGRGRVLIEVEDNGPGITEEAQEKIFVPFFTTKENGSGIGLSLSKEVMRLHRGSIHLSSTPGERTIFSLRF
jgi:signal transduction histidine kinase